MVGVIMPRSLGVGWGMGKVRHVLFVVSVFFPEHLFGVYRLPGRTM
ncbi:MAG: hypothetical protein LBB83_07325 [Treponema sp.]|nr:hypothetical protein [Treponema sp.]